MTGIKGMKRGPNFCFPALAGHTVMQLTVDGYCQDHEMCALLEATFPELKKKGQPEYLYSHLNYLFKRDTAKAPAQLVADYHVAVKKKRLDLLDKANNNKGQYQQYYTKCLLEMRGDPAYDSYSQRDKDREISDSWLHADKNPNADCKTEEQLDRYHALTSKSKRKARVAKKETKKVSNNGAEEDKKKKKGGDSGNAVTINPKTMAGCESELHLDGPTFSTRAAFFPLAAPSSAPPPRATSGPPLSLKSDKDGSDNKWEALELEADFALWGNQLLSLQARRMLREAGSDTELGDDKGGLTSDDKAGARVGQSIPFLDDFLDPPSASPRLDRQNGLKRLRVYRGALKTAHNLNCHVLAAPASPANPPARTSSSSGSGCSSTPTPILGDLSLCRLQTTSFRLSRKRTRPNNVNVKGKGKARAVDLDLTVNLNLTVDSSASDDCNDGNNRDSNNEDNNHDGNYSDTQVLDQGADTAAGRPAVVTQQNGAARYTNPIKPGQALVTAGSCTLHRVVGLLTVPLAYDVSLYRPSLTFARKLVARYPPRTKILVNLISDAGRAASTRVRHASNDTVWWDLFGAGTAGIFMVVLRILPAALSCRAFEARLSVYFDANAHDTSAVASALSAAGASLSHFRVVAPSSTLSKRQERLLTRLCGPAHAAAKRTFLLKRTAMSPFAPACAHMPLRRIFNQNSTSSATVHVGAKDKHIHAEHCRTVLVLPANIWRTFSVNCNEVVAGPAPGIELRRDSGEGLLHKLD